MGKLRALTNELPGLSARDRALLTEMCAASNALYNIALRNTRRRFYEDGSLLPYAENYHLCVGTPEYLTLQAGLAQQVLKDVERAFKRFLTARRFTDHGRQEPEEAYIPSYKPDGALNRVTIPANSIRVRDGKLLVPTSLAFAAMHGIKIKFGDGRVALPFPGRLVPEKDLRAAIITPKAHGRLFEVSYIYDGPDMDLHLPKADLMGVHVGLDNLASCVTSKGTALLVRGRLVKAINRRYNEELARLRAAGAGERRMDELALARDRRIMDQFRKAARLIIEHCAEHGVGTLVIGKDGPGPAGDGFEPVDFRKFRKRLSTLCDAYGLRFIERDADGALGASFLDGDRPGECSGAPVGGGLYRSKRGRVVNAGLNAAANVAVWGWVRPKGKGREGLRRALAVTPEVARPYDMPARRQPAGLDVSGRREPTA